MNMRMSEATTHIPSHVRKPGAINKCSYLRMFPLTFCSGALMAIMTEPTTQRKHPTLPNRVRCSCKKIADKIAHTTTDKAPMGVTSTASANMYATKFSTSPSIIMIMPVHHIALFRYACDSPGVVLYLRCAANNPFFLKTNDDPINSPLPTASPRPIYLNPGGFASSPPALMRTQPL